MEYVVKEMTVEQILAYYGGEDALPEIIAQEIYPEDVEDIYILIFWREEVISIQSAGCGEADVPYCQRYGWIIEQLMKAFELGANSVREENS